MFNPLVINGIIPYKYFCDREKETEKLLMSAFPFCALPIRKY